MQYKGEDLDLRVPHTRTPRDPYAGEYESGYANGRMTRARSTSSGSQNDPLWVDEVVLACCNYAFDVAKANGAAEVELEHLVNALTRVDAAARQLEARGVHEGQLRRESATLIASEVPAANAGDALAPRRSAELEDVLRRAGDIAYRRGTAAGVDDVLWVLLHYGRDLPVVLLLRRLTPDWQRADWGRGREMHIPSVPEPVSRPIQLVANDGVSARVAGIEDSLRMMHMEFASERKLLSDLVRDLQRDVVAQRGDNAALRGDLSQRLDGIERAVQVRSEASRIPIQIVDRLVAVEKAVNATMGEALQATNHIAQRLSALEVRIGDGGDGIAVAKLDDRMAALEKAVHGGLGEGARNWANLGQRLQAIETTAGETGKRLVAMQDTSGPANARWNELTGRLDAMSRMIEVMTAESNKARLALAEHFDAIETSIQAVPMGTQAPPAELIERIGGLERAVRAGFGEAAATTASIAERLNTVERHVSQTRDEGEGMLILDDRLGSIERLLELRGNEAQSSRQEIVERLRLLEAKPSVGGNVDVTALTNPLVSRLTSLETASSSNVDALKTALSEITNKLVQLDERVRTDAVANEEALRGRDQDFDFIYNEIKQLGQSQATLNSAVSDWRSESQNHFGTLADRLDQMKLQSVDSIRSSVDLPSVVTNGRNGSRNDGMVDVSIKPKAASGEEISADNYALPSEPGRGFWYWLFGTDNVARANRENDLKVDRMRQNIREAKEKRRMQV
ncbi:MAG: hypothetical protein R3D67_02750 [Hyphomicrobiaceae bacterium]